MIKALDTLLCARHNQVSLKLFILKLVKTCLSSLEIETFPLKLTEREIETLHFKKISHFSYICHQNTKLLLYFDKIINNATQKLKLVITRTWYYHVLKLLPQSLVFCRLDWHKSQELLHRLKLSFLNELD